MISHHFWGSKGVSCQRLLSAPKKKNGVSFFSSLLSLRGGALALGAWDSTGLQKAAQRPYEAPLFSITHGVLPTPPPPLPAKGTTDAVEASSSTLVLLLEPASPEGELFNFKYLFWCLLAMEDQNQTDQGRGEGE